jgi:hypothetical protein
MLHCLNREYVLTSNNTDGYGMKGSSPSDQFLCNESPLNESTDHVLRVEVRKKPETHEFTLKLKHVALVALPFV